MDTPESYIRKKYPESFGRWCWRRMMMNSWTDSVKNEDITKNQGVKKH
jgi:hypothetical protein